MTLSDDIAFRIYQSILDGSGDGVNLGDFSRYHPFFQIPSFIETFERRHSIDTLETLRLAFEAVQQGLRDIGATQLMRVCSVAQFVGSDTIRGVHDTHLLDAAGQVVETYAGMCTLGLSDGQWRVALCQFAEEAESLPSRTLRNQLQDNSPALD